MEQEIAAATGHVLRPDRWERCLATPAPKRQAALMELLNQAALTSHQAALPPEDMVRFQGAGCREASACFFRR